MCRWRRRESAGAGSAEVTVIVKVLTVRRRMDRAVHADGVRSAGPACGSPAATRGPPRGAEVTSDERADAAEERDQRCPSLHARAVVLERLDPMLLLVVLQGRECRRELDVHTLHLIEPGIHDGTRPPSTVRAMAREHHHRPQGDSSRPRPCAHPAATSGASIEAGGYQGDPPVERMRCIAGNQSVISPYGQAAPCLQINAG